MKKFRKFSFLPGSVLYLILLVVSVIATQALRNTVSAVFFWFMIIAPVISLIHSYIGARAMQVYVMAEKSRCNKSEDVEYEIRIINPTPFSYPFVDAYVFSPDPEGVRCNEKRLALSLIPFSNYSIKDHVEFRYRGVYDIGVRHMYITDIFRIFRFGIDVNNVSPVMVYPRKLPLVSDSLNAVTDMESRIYRVTDGDDRAEVSKIRDYIPGDSLKDIHWKLSAKSEDLQVKEYKATTAHHVYVFVDLAGMSDPPEDPEGYDDISYVQASPEKMKDISADIEKANEFRSGNLADDTCAVPEDVKKKKKRSKRERKEAERKKRQSRKIAKKERDSFAVMIDQLITDTCRKEVNRKRKQDAKDDKELEKTTSRNGNIVFEKKVGHILDAIKNDDEADSAARKKKKGSRSYWGGSVKDADRYDMDEFCADGVTESAISLVKNEILSGNECTVCWYDDKYDSGISEMEVADGKDFDDFFERMAVAGNVDSVKHVSGLAPLIKETQNVTARIVTSNIDPVNTDEYCSVLSDVGGTGSGNICEVILYDPVQRYNDPDIRRAYVESCASRMEVSGVALKEAAFVEDKDGNTSLVW